jgi:voltage-gated potassium channel
VKPGRNRKPSRKRFRPMLAVAAGALSALREPHIAILLMMTFSLIGCATVFYHWQEGWRWLDAAYFSVVTIASVGYGDLTPKTDGGKLFTILYIFSGIGLFVASAAALANHIIHNANGGPGEH